MECKEIRKLIRHGSRVNDVDRERLVTHTNSCHKCRVELASERLTTALIKAHSPKHSESAENPYLMHRIRARILELSEHGTGSWESAILSLRGWLIAFGAAAALLLTISLQWQLSHATAANERDTELTVLSGMSEDFISGNLNTPTKSSEKFTPPTEAFSDAHK